MKRLRISAISYLNTAPLMWDFEHGDAGATFDISYTVPSQCAADLAAGIGRYRHYPGGRLCQHSGLAILPGVAIASRRPVRSILLVSKVPLDQIESVALDTSSLTSVALTKVLFAKWWGAGRTFQPMAPDIEKMMQEHDAGLVIGDPALKVDRSRYLTYDLAEEWIRLPASLLCLPFGRCGRQLWRMFPRPSIWRRCFRTRATMVCSPGIWTGLLANGRHAWV